MPKRKPSAKLKDVVPLCRVPECLQELTSSTCDGKTASVSFPEDPLTRLRWAQALGLSVIEIGHRDKVCFKHFSAKQKGDEEDQIPLPWTKKSRVAIFADSSACKYVEKSPYPEAPINRFFKEQLELQTSANLANEYAQLVHKIETDWSGLPEDKASTFSQGFAHEVRAWDLKHDEHHRGGPCPALRKKEEDLNYSFGDHGIVPTQALTVGGDRDPLGGGGDDMSYKISKTEENGKRKTANKNKNAYIVTSNKVIQVTQVPKAAQIFQPDSSGPETSLIRHYTRHSLQGQSQVIEVIPRLPMLPQPQPEISCLLPKTPLPVRVEKTTRNKVIRVTPMPPTAQIVQLHRKNGINYGTLLGSSEALKVVKMDSEVEFKGEKCEDQDPIDITNIECPNDFKLGVTVNAFVTSKCDSGNEDKSHPTKSACQAAHPKGTTICRENYATLKYPCKMCKRQTDSAVQFRNHLKKDHQIKYININDLHNYCRS